MTVSIGQSRIIELAILNGIVVCIFHIIPTHQKIIFIISDEKIRVLIKKIFVNVYVLLSLTYILPVLSVF